MTETLVSMLIIVTSLTIMAGGITTGAQINKQADTRYAVVFPPPMKGEGAHFTKDQYDVSFRLSFQDSSRDGVYEELNRRLAAAPAAEGTGKTVEMKPLRVNVRKELAVDRNGSERTWRVLYVLEGVEENGAGGGAGDGAGGGAEDETKPEENKSGE